jgi:hypothetical protein
MIRDRRALLAVMDDATRSCGMASGWKEEQDDWLPWSVVKAANPVAH